MIESYSFGSIKIDGKKYDHDVMISNGEVKKWWRNQGHVVQIDDLKDIPDNLMFLIIGTGASGECKVPERTQKYIKDKGIQLVIEVTLKAVDAYNRVVEKGASVVGAFHLTC